MIFRGIPRKKITGNSAMVKQFVTTSGREPSCLRLNALRVDFCLSTRARASRHVRLTLGRAGAFRKIRMNREINLRASGQILEYGDSIVRDDLLYQSHSNHSWMLSFPAISRLDLKILIGISGEKRCLREKTSECMVSTRTGPIKCMQDVMTVR